MDHLWGYQELHICLVWIPSWDSREILNTTFNGKWISRISRYGPFGMVPRSPDLFTVDFFLLGHSKNPVCIGSTYSLQDLLKRIGQNPQQKGVTGDFFCASLLNRMTIYTPVYKCFQRLYHRNVSSLFWSSFYYDIISILLQLI